MSRDAIDLEATLLFQEFMAKDSKYPVKKFRKDNGLNSVEYIFEVRVSWFKTIYIGIIESDDIGWRQGWKMYEVVFYKNCHFVGENVKARLKGEAEELAKWWVASYRADSLKCKYTNDMSILESIKKFIRRK
jgi:hypothetical protein